MSDLGLGGIFAVDLASGNRTLFIQPFPAVLSPGDNVPSGIYLDAAHSRSLALRLGSVSNVFSVALTGESQQIISGDNPTTSTSTPTGTGPLPLGCLTLDVSPADEIAFLACPWISSVMAVDLVSGDRVMIAR